MVEQVKNKKKKIVEILMSQEIHKGIGSGLGNYLVPEILYDAQLSPHRTLDSLTHKELLTLSHSIKHILRLCYMTNETKYIGHLEGFLKEHKKLVAEHKFPNYHSSVKIGKEKFQFRVYRKK